MGEETTRTTDGNEYVSPPNGPGRGSAGAGIRAGIGRRIAAATGGSGQEEIYESPPGARLATGEQAVGRKQDGRKREAEPERATVADATSAAKSTLSPLRLATRALGQAFRIDATMTAEERADIAEPLTRIYQRHPQMAAWVNRYTDPVMLVGAIAVYVLRILDAYQQTRLVMAQTALLERQTGARIRQAPVVQPTPIRQEAPAPGYYVDGAPAPSQTPPGPVKVDGPSFAELDGIMSMGR